MLSRDQRQLVNYSLDAALYFCDEWSDFSRSSVRDSLRDTFLRILKREFLVEVIDEMRGGSKAIPNLKSGQMRMILRCLEQALIDFADHFGKAHLRQRKHRVKIRDIFTSRVSAGLRTAELSGLEQARKYLEKEKEKLAYGEN